ncbi:MAG: hypothetical protein IJ523_04765 [Succinivibrionaceae bacterium]|nr:hypothetical protein [Succinivibrionaceae bacterium]
MFQKSPLAAVVLSATISAAAYASTFEADSVGRDEASAVKNAQVKAVRDAMRKMIDQDFIKSHVREIRSEIIMKSDDFVIGTQIGSSAATESGNVKVSASVEVDDRKLASSLLCLGADVNVFYRPAEPVGCNAGGSAASGTSEPSSATETSSVSPQTAAAPPAFNLQDLVIRPVSPKLFEDAAPFVGSPVTDDMNVATDIIGQAVATGVATAIKTNPGHVAAQRLFKSDDGGVVYDLLEDNVSFLRMIVHSAARGDTVDSRIAFDEENLKKVLKKAPPFLHDTLGHALATFAVRYQPLLDIADISFDLNSRLNLADIEVECNNARQMLTLYDFISTHGRRFDLKNRIDRISVSDPEGKSAHNYYNLALEVQNRPEVNLVRIGLEKYAGNTRKFGPVTVERPSLELAARRAADGGDNHFDYGIRKRVKAFTGLGMDIRDAELTLGLRDLDFTSLSQICHGTAENPINVISAVNCIVGAEDMNALLVGSMKGFFASSSGADLSLKATLNNQPLELAASAYLGNVKDDMNSFAVAPFKGYLRVGSGIFDMPQYHLQDMAPFAKGFAKDPNAAVYEYDILYIDGKLSINGKTVFGQ